MKYIIEIVRLKDEEIVERMECFSERQAERAEGGVNINLNHDKFYTRIVEKADEQ